MSRVPFVTYFGYNAFIVRDGSTTVCIDPGRNLKWNRLNSLIPEDCWPDIDLILLTHEHDDHSDYAVDVAKKSNATVVCHEQLAERYRSKLGTSQVIGLLPGRDIELEPRISIETFHTVHGKLRRNVLGREFAIQPRCPPSGFDSLLIRMTISISATVYS
jgi:L-ascorbate metabolism protein UlaG (beta-lactamase superfamily)